ncbi:MAG: hypothetical protein OXN20_03985 [Gemmatimonadota bacterium]|nr:hypothetical protein [Gemmatimonadota bacterium]
MSDTNNKAKKGKLDSIKEFANESRLLAALLDRGYNASRVDLPHSTYDIVVEIATRDVIRIQVKTVSPLKSIPFTSGGRGGVDRTYRSDVKTYVHNTETCDIIVGVESLASNGDQEINFYFVPTLFIEKLGQRSITIRKIPQAKNNWEILDRCREMRFVYEIFGRLFK